MKLDPRKSRALRGAVALLGTVIALALPLSAQAQPAVYPTPGSCQPYVDGSDTVEVCGRRWHAGGIASNYFDLDGCSCAPDCGYQGTCCPDAVEYCQTQEVFGYAPPLLTGGGFDTQHMDGDHWVTLIEPVGMSSVNGTILGNQLGGFQYRGLAPAPDRMAGLTKVGFNSFETKDNSVGCWVRRSPDVDGNPHWFVGSLAACGDWDHDDNGESWTPRGCTKKELFSECAAAALAQPSASRGGPFLQNPAEQLYTGCENSGTSGCGPLYKTAVLGPIIDANGDESFPLLERVMMTEYDRILSTRWPSNQCHIVENDGNWLLVSWSDQTYGDAICRASTIKSTSESILPSACPSTDEVLHHRGGGGGGTTCIDENLTTPLFRAHAWGGGFSLPLRESHYSEVSMFSDTTHACFLQRVKIEGDFDTTSSGDDKAACEVYERNSRWWLKARSEGDGNVTCEARCLRIPRSHRDPARPPGEEGRGYPLTWPPRPSHVAESEQTRARSDLVGPHMELFQSGNYDRPLVIVEGFDAGNSQSVGDNVRQFGPLIRLAMQYGIDVWIVDMPDGSVALDEMARQNAMAFRYAYRHNFFNAQYGAHKIAVMGFSGGGVTARLAMAYWDQQRFKTPSDPLYLSNDYGHGPPVSHFATVASPHLGANVPLSLQVIVQDLGGDFDIGSSYESLNSQAARELLGARIGSGCNDVITETCYGNRVPIDDGTVECNDGVTCGNFGNRCVIDFNSHKDTSFEWPTTPHVALVSNGSWSPQSCESLPDSEIERCTDTVGPGPFSLDTELGYLRFVLDQGYFFTLCDRESRISARLSEWDLRPGDNLGGALAGVAIGGIPKEIKDLMIEQNIPYTFSHTDSALACAGMSDDVECRQFNRSEGRADHVASNPGRGPLADQPDVNGFHKSLDYRLAYQVIAFVFDAWAGDRDGWCDPEANLVLAEFNEKMTPLGVPPLTGCLDPVGDCNDGSTRSYPGAPEVCDDLDNDCDGEFDEGFTGKGIPCDNGQLGACYRAGVTACNATRDGVECNAEYVPPGPREICDNGIDDDCDGLLNEGCPGGGGCAKGDCFTESPTGP